MISRRCSKCGDYFETDAAWKRTCLPCWKATKNAQEGANGARTGYDLTKALEIELRAAKAALKAAEIPTEILRLLTQLCHPDRNNQSEASVRAMQWINERRKAAR